MAVQDNIAGVDEKEVPFQPENVNYDQKPDEPQAQAKEDSQQDELDKIVPSSEPRTWTLGSDDFQRTYVQKEMSFIAKAQWFSLVGKALDKALSGPDGMSLNSLLDAPTRGGIFNLADFKDADMFVQAIGKLLSAAPDFLVESYLIWLNVPDYDRPVARDLMQLPPDEGGLTDEQGMAIIETFLDQNYNALANFFGKRLQALGNRVTKLNQLRESQQSKR